MRSSASVRRGSGGTWSGALAKPPSWPPAAASPTGRRSGSEASSIACRIAAGHGVGRSTVARIVTPDGFELRLALAPRDTERVERVLEGWFRDQARLAIEATVADHAAALEVTPAAISLRDPRSRWGSASRQGRLMFSWRLVLAPPEALETVVIHELAHLRVFGHGPRFWAVVASRRADHLVWRRWLRTHSLELHGALRPSIPLEAAATR